jgi:gp37
MQNPQEVANRIKNYAKKRKVSISKMLNDCDLNKNTLFTMQSRGSWLQVNNLAIIADYLDCSIDYLMGRTDIPEVNCGSLMEKAVLTDEELWKELQKEKRIDDLIERLIKEGELTEDESAKIKDVLK